MKVHQHIPGFVDGFNPVKAEVNSLDEFEALEFIQRWRAMPDFYRFSVDRRDYLPGKGFHLLMAETITGHYWVVAYLEGDLAPLANLPNWHIA